MKEETPVDLLFVLRDSDNSGPEKRRTEVESATSLRDALLAASQASGKRRREEEKKRFSERRRVLLERLDADGEIAKFPGWQRLRENVERVIQVLS